MGGLFSGGSGSLLMVIFMVVIIFLVFRLIIELIKNK